MRILLDENLPARLVRSAPRAGSRCGARRVENLSGHPDAEVRALSESEDRVLITQDIRFADARAFAVGAHPGLILVRLKSPGRRALVAKVKSIFESENVESWRGCFVVLSDSKLRVRRAG